MKPLEKPAMYFIGVTTGSSSILKIFPLWAEVLGVDAQLIGHDLPLDASAGQYREIVTHIKKDPLARGALVTSHKINLLNATRDLFDFLDANAILCDEISSISKLENRLEGHAVDPISSRLTWSHFVPDGHFARTNSSVPGTRSGPSVPGRRSGPSVPGRRSGPSVLCFGAGGAAIAISVAVARLEDRPKKFVCVDRDPLRLEMLKHTHDQLDTGVKFEYVLSENALENDARVATLEPGSIIINATGMGKDRPGSPVTDAVRFPDHAIIWELNYRGSLEFWRQAKSQSVTHHLQLEDGWVYFLHGWTQVIAQVFHLRITPDIFAKLERAASSFRQPI
jgi:shikimate dehydrogenase